MKIRIIQTNLISYNGNQIQKTKQYCIHPDDIESLQSNINRPVTDHSANDLITYTYGLEKDDCIFLPSYSIENGIRVRYISGYFYQDKYTRDKIYVISKPNIDFEHPLMQYSLIKDNFDEPQLWHDPQIGRSFEPILD